MKRTWRICRQAPDYKVSSCGTMVKKIKTGKLMWFDRVGRAPYVMTTLTVNGEPKRFGIHILVCTAFHGPGKKGQVVLHKNDDYSSNAATNVRWGTQKENCAETDRSKFEKNPLKPHHKEIIELFNSGLSAPAIAVMYGVRKSTIDHVLHRSKTSKQMYVRPGRCNQDLRKS